MFSQETYAFHLSVSEIQQAAIRLGPPDVLEYIPRPLSTISSETSSSMSTICASHSVTNSITSLVNALSDFIIWRCAALFLERGIPGNTTVSEHAHSYAERLDHGHGRNGSKFVGGDISNGGPVLSSSSPRRNEHSKSHQSDATGHEGGDLAVDGQVSRSSLEQLVKYLFRPHRGFASAWTGFRTTKISIRCLAFYGAKIHRVANSKLDLHQLDVAMHVGDLVQYPIMTSLRS